MRIGSEWKLAPALLASAMLVGCGGETSAPAASDPAASAPAASAPAASTPASDAAPAAGSEKKGDGSGDKTSDAPFNVENLPTLALLVPKIHCEYCAAKVNTSLAAVEGVEDVSIDVETKTATVAINADSFDADSAIQTLADDLSYEATVVTEAEAPADAG